MDAYVRETAEILQRRGREEYGEIACKRWRERKTEREREGGRETGR